MTQRCLQWHKHEKGDDNQGEQAEDRTTENRSKVECENREGWRWLWVGEVKALGKEVGF